LLGLIGFQAALGMWTVTLKLLPVVVMGHLLGGLLTFVSLVYLNWRLSSYSGIYRPTWRVWVNLGIGIVFCQIALGGWVSANYAGIACVGFPTCNGEWLPQLYWLDSFNFWSKIGANYQGGLLESACRVTIQIVHRFGASVTLVYVTSLSCIVLCRVKTPKVKRLVLALLSCLVVQCLLGIANVVYLLPLWVAVAHNAVAALLLAAIVSLRYSLLGAPDVRVT
jgi:cytochrome c oxidase assembly protein subunit 15